MIDAAYPVPFTLDRPRTSGALQLTNRSAESLRGVSFTLDARGCVSTTAPLRVESGQRVRVTVRGDHLSRRSVLIVRWFRPDGEEYLWRISF